ncbi:MAG: caspase family protein [Rhodobacteraceae bacterium]|nr:caspase family protein [Paracoccaceae bacterium]
MTRRPPLRPLPALSALALAFGWLAPAEAAAAVRALLVGVSAYDHLEGVDLRGPRNDVALLASALIDRGVDPAAITVLADGAPGLHPAIATGRPTRGAILAAMDGLAAATGQGDTVIFYYSGHGSQAPDSDGDEGGGWDEILLPADVRGWSGRRGAVENALVDDELNDWARTVLADGAALVGIIDSCHSGTAFRGLEAAGVGRDLAPARLGVPAADAAPAAHPGARREDAALGGEFVFLYAAQAGERAFEYPVGPAADPANWHGEFTRALVAALTGAPDLSWATLFAAATDDMRRDATGRPAQTPDAEGTGLDTPVVGAATADAGRLRVAGTTLAAGRLHGIAAGAVVAVYAGAAGGAPLGRARVVRAEATEATLAPEDGLVLPARGHAELLAPGAPPPVRFSPPRRADPADGLDYAPFLSALAAARGVVEAEFDAADYDLGLVLDEGALVLTGPDGVIDARGPGTSPRVTAAEAGELAGLLGRAARVERLRRALALAERAAARSFTVYGPPVAVTIAREPHATGGAECARAASGPLEPGIDPARRPLAHCDVLRLALANGSRRAQDVTVLYVDRSFHVSVLWPLAGQGNRLEPGTRQEVALQLLNPAGIALEELIVIAVPAAEGAPRTDLSLLADDVTLRDLASSATGDFLLAAIDPGPTLRDFPAAPAAPDPITVYRTAVTVRSPQS